MTFGGPAPSRWFSRDNTSWDRAARMWDQIEKNVDRAAVEATELHILAPMREAMRNDPSINGTDNEGWAMSGEVADALQVFQHEGELRFGVPPDHPAADSIVKQEYGDTAQPPSPHFRNALFNGSMEKVQEEFLKRVTDAH